MSDPKHTASRLVLVQPLTGYDQALSYIHPDAVGDLRPGHLVRIPLGRRSCQGIVLGAAQLEKVPDPTKLKPVYERIYDQPIILPETLKLARWMHQYYTGSFESVFEAMIPAAVRNGVAEKKNRFLKIKRPLSEAAVNALQSKAPKQAKLYLYLLKLDHMMKQAELVKTLGISASVCSALVEKGVLEWIEESQVREAYTDDIAESEVIASASFSLNPEQNAAIDSISESLDQGEFCTHLLHGVTGSGKTEVYLGAIRKVLSEGGGVIFLVPEVALTPQTVGRLRSRLSELNTQTVVWHSMLSAGERFDAWMRLASGEARIVVGARSAVFAPVQNLRLIVVDEEHEPAYKQGETPRYNGRDVAVYRTMLQQAVCVLGSATPSLESLYNTKIGRYKLNRLESRVDDRQLPSFRIVDMKREMLRLKSPPILSSVLLESLYDRFEKREQSILFLNRRGYSSSMMCPECGYVAMSPDSSVSLTYHRTDESLRCHLTGHTEPAPKFCPGCGSGKIRWRGFGTQKVEDVLGKAIPRARVVRMDADTMSKKNQFREILSSFRKGDIDILLGTQMIAKGLDFPNVTLVGILDADLSLHMPDFRASERTFQLLVQVAGRAGRGDVSGEVVVQSYLPSSAPIQYAKRSDFDGFLEDELSQRKEFNYPPYRHLIRHLFRGRNDQKVSFYAEQWAKCVDSALGEQIEIRGPAPAPLEKIRGEYRFHLWYFTNKVSAMIPKILALRSTFPRDKDVIDVMDVDPVDLA